QGEDAVDVILLGRPLGGTLGETVGALECDLTVLGDDDIDAVIITALDISLDSLFDALELCWVQSHGGVCFLQVENVVWWVFLGQVGAAGGGEDLAGVVGSCV